MAQIIRASEGDILDTICQAHYGRVTGTVEAVLEANPGLALVSQPYHAGVEILLPDVAVAATVASVKLWD